MMFSLIVAQFKLRAAKDFHLQQRDFNTRTAHPYTLCGWHTLSDIPLTSVPTRVGDDKSVDILIQIAPGHSPAVAEIWVGSFLNTQAKVGLSRY